MSKKTMGISLIVVGVIVLLLSILADVFGIGATASFGYRQIIGSILGLILVVIGFVLNRK